MMLNKPILMEFRYDPLSKTYRFKYTGWCGISHLRGRIGNPDLVYLGQGNYWAVVATPDNDRYRQPPPAGGACYRTFCGT